MTRDETPPPPPRPPRCWLRLAATFLAVTTALVAIVWVRRHGY